ncbi:MAG: N-6 DNA methylase, partial [Chlorobiales bacterium]|nr:N-6 DNA methylase [Chlorobiales bacterium]
THWLGFMFPKDYKERILPDLSRNIVCGNSLVEKDFWGIFDDEKDAPQDRRKINAMDFETAFHEVLKQGGFDAIVGNPPYVRQETLGDKFKKYAKEKFKTFAGTADLFVYFIERGISKLKPGGQYGIIVANKWMRANYGKPLRSWLKNTSTHKLEEVTDFGDLPVFQGATTYPCIIRVSKQNGRNREFFAAEVKTLDFTDLSEYVAANRFTMQAADLDDNGWTLVNTKTLNLLQKLRAAGVPLGEYVDGKIYYGIKTGLNEAFVIDETTKLRLINKDPKSAELIKPFLAGRDIKRYQEPKSDKYLISIPNGWTKVKMGPSKQNETTSWKWLKETYPAIAEHLEPFEKAGKKRWDKGEYWWELRPCDYYPEFEKPKMMLPDIATRGNFMRDADKKFYCVNTAYMIPIDDLFLLGLLNSRLITFFYSQLTSTIRGGYLRFIFQYLEQIPIVKLDLKKKEEKALHDKVVGLVEEMLKTKKELSETMLGYRKTQLETEIETLDRRIDALVYELYGLSEEEIALVEGTGD